jgi:hypothetical protein
LLLVFFCFEQVDDQVQDSLTHREDQ